MVARGKALHKRARRLLVLVTMQQKGGVGKTTIAKTLAVYHAVYRKVRVLLMDFDPQCNLSNKFLQMQKRQGREGYLPPAHPDFDPRSDADWDGLSSCAGLFHAGILLPYPTHYEKLEILPGEGERLGMTEQQLPETLKHKVINRPREWLTDEEVQGAYDLVIIDTPPSRQALARGALRAATHLLIPMEPETNSEEGLSDMLEMWRSENLYRGEDDAVQMLGILPNKVKQYGKHDMALHAGIIQSLRQDQAIGHYVLPYVLHHKPIIAESDFPQASHRTIFDMLPPGHKDRRETEVFCRDIESKLFGDVTG